MVLVRDRLFSLRWLMVLLLLLVPILNLFWFYKIQGLEQELPLLLLIFSGMVVPFLWIAGRILLRFLIFDVLMGFLGEVSESFSGMRQGAQQWLQQRDAAELHQHEDMMDRIRRVRRSWSEKKLSREDAVSEISRLKGKKRKPSKTAKRKQREKTGEEMPSLMSGFIDRVLSDKERK